MEEFNCSHFEPLGDCRKDCPQRSPGPGTCELAVGKAQVGDKRLVSLTPEYAPSLPERVFQGWALRELKDESRVIVFRMRRSGHLEIEGGDLAGEALGQFGESGRGACDPAEECHVGCEHGSPEAL